MFWADVIWLPITFRNLRLIQLSMPFRLLSLLKLKFIYYKLFSRFGTLVKAFVAKLIDLRVLLSPYLTLRSTSKTFHPFELSSMSKRLDY